MKRILLYLATNLAVILVINIVLNIVFHLFGLSSSIGDIKGLLVLSVVVGFTGSIISLLMSKTLAVRSVNAQIITIPRNAAETWLVNTVASLANQWNVSG